MVGCSLWDQPTEGKVRPIYVIGLTSSSLTGPRHVLQWTPNVAGKLVESSPGGEVYALSEMVRHMSPLRDFYAPFERLGTGIMGMEDCEQRAQRVATGKHPVRRLLRIQQALEQAELDNVYWLPVVENPADGLPKVCSDVVPLSQ